MDSISLSNEIKTKSVYIAFSRIVPERNSPIMTSTMTFQVPIILSPLHLMWK